MNDKITTLLNKLTPNEHQMVQLLILRIKQDDTKGLDIKRLNGHTNLLRVRQGRLRVVYYKSSKAFRVLRVDRRGYKPQLVSVEG
jgi:mRNA-degrading endonuclease RelE of RelBE toxin-antitoxin system